MTTLSVLLSVVASASSRSRPRCAKSLLNQINNNNNIKHQTTMNNNSLQTTTMHEFSREQIELIKRTVAPNTTDNELALFLHAARKYNLDPLLKEIWCVKYNSNAPVSIFTSRDGYLKIAHASGQFDGINSYTIDDEQGNPVKAVCEVWRKDMSRPFRAEVKFKEYFNQNNPTWRKYPSAMLIKVAEVFALRRAFCISGIATVEEHESPASPAPTPAPTPTPYKMTDKEREKAIAIINRFHIEKRQRALSMLDTLTESQVNRLINEPPFISDEARENIVDSLKHYGISRDGFITYLRETYDIDSIENITLDIYDDVMSDIEMMSRESESESKES